MYRLTGKNIGFFSTKHLKKWPLDLWGQNGRFLYVRMWIYLCNSAYDGLYVVTWNRILFLKIKSYVRMENCKSIEKLRCILEEQKCIYHTTWVFSEYTKIWFWYFKQNEVKKRFPPPLWVGSLFLSPRVSFMGFPC